MKSSRYKKVIGLAIGDRSVMAAEVVAGARPQVRRVAELVYREGVTVNEPAELGKAIGDMLREKGFSAKQAVVGVPVKWLVVKPKEVPASDRNTLISVLRLEAETEFSSELKDMVFEFAGNAPADQQFRSVLLMATPQRQIAAVATICEAAKLTPVAVMPSALALGELTAASYPGEVVVLSVGETGSELAAQNGNTSNAIRHLRPPQPQPMFINEVRRAVSTLGPNKGREMVLFDGTGIDTNWLAEQIGVKVRGGELSEFGIDTSLAASNGDGSKYAAAVALGAAGVTGLSGLDFLHSRLAPPEPPKIPPWAYAVALTVILLIVGGVYGYNDLQKAQTKLDGLNAQIAASKDAVDAAKKFNSTVNFVKAWHADDPRYLACWRDLTLAVPVDGYCYFSKLDIKEAPIPIAAAAHATALKGLAGNPGARALSGSGVGLAPDQVHVQQVLAFMQKNPLFSGVTLASLSNNPRTHEVAFTINFTYTPRPVVAATTVPSTAPSTRRGFLR